MGTTIRILFASVGLVLAVLAGGCAHVAPYERGQLARPDMVAGDLAGSGAEHVRAVREGASGGSIGPESGCGCN
jgi:hypothetical protein